MKDGLSRPSLVQMEGGTVDGGSEWRTGHPLGRWCEGGTVDGGSEWMTGHPSRHWCEGDTVDGRGEWPSPKAHQCHPRRHWCEGILSAKG